MGVGGTLECFSGLFGSGNKKEKSRLQTVELKMRIDCEAGAEPAKILKREMSSLAAKDSCTWSLL